MATSKRIASVDILRGLTIVAMILVNTPGDWGYVYAPLLHATWHGLTPTDLIFPFFLYIVGISIYYAYKNKANSRDTYKKIGIRSLKLIGLGLFLNVFTPLFPFVEHMETFRIPGVLQRIGIVFFIVSIIYLNCNWKQILAICLTILLGYYLFLGFVPLPNGALPTFNRAENNWANYIDLQLLGNHMWQPDYDPEGILSTIPSVASCLIGVLIAKVLDGLAPLKPLLITAFALLISGYGFSLIFPINKAIWSSSFVLVTSGWGTLILAVIYYFRDIKEYQFGSIFKYVGTNAITIYFLSSFISKCMYSIKLGENHNIHSWLYQSLFFPELISAKLASLLYALVVVAFYVLLGYIMFQKKIFIKV
ncbi:acyltransferase family protein [Pseudotamlana carrageenivorans]|uniref:Heparan-alpha-glucosaminide N-acetyltransferase n=1 Tax=Pseudotamlana carrageenivorans TaxID=2069432 RepID=A0A2I7SKW2_9FLAO|nr:heparan-alpha-glucosaminide N-acetyltransferase domain-containing protein [Tamlana carrageenivorans]AUS06551.1 heparan-alpha-glucosaminide N-acetyltransferase [Tamlana carrageenivorans]